MKDTTLQDVFEVYEEVGNVCHLLTLRKDIPASDDIYNEDKVKHYKELCTLFTFPDLEPKAETISDLGLKKQCSAVFKVCALDLQNNDVLDADFILKDELNLLRSVIQFKGVSYSVVNVCPRSAYMNSFLTYAF